MIGSALEWNILIMVLIIINVENDFQAHKSDYMDPKVMKKATLNLYLILLHTVTGKSNIIHENIV